MEGNPSFRSTSFRPTTFRPCFFCPMFWPKRQVFSAQEKFEVATFRPVNRWRCNRWRNELIRQTKKEPPRNVTYTRPFPTFPESFWFSTRVICSSSLARDESLKSTKMVGAEICLRCQRIIVISGRRPEPRVACVSCGKHIHLTCYSERGKSFYYTLEFVIM